MNLNRELIQFMKWYKNNVPIATQKESHELVDDYFKFLQFPAELEPDNGHITQDQYESAQNIVWDYEDQIKGTTKHQAPPLNVTDIKDCSLDLIEKLADCNISQNHTERWGVIFGKYSRSYSFMHEDKTEVLKWIKEKYK